jgi:TetR/AcrR family transcriptional regulator, mexJK operon transcriptional repressor
VFLTNGFTDTSVDAIAAEAGVSKQTIYNHFGDKERLFATVVETTQQDAYPAAEPDLEDRLANSDDLDRDLRALGRHWVSLTLAEDVAALRRLVIAEWTRHPQLLDDWARPRPQMESALAGAIQRQTQRGVLDVPDAALAARQLMLLIITESLTRAFYGLRKLSKTEADEIVGTGVEMWLRCYRARPAS